jgi:photosystem II stability/assembly factor-like uncharacterized protein/predicted Ser/Thr protein kinase
MPELIGKTLGSYRIVEQIGLGGMATVFKAYQPSMDRYVAFKVISTHLAQDPTFVKRFQQEAKVIAKLEHLHILPVYDHGEQDGYLYLVMRFIEAGTLKDRMAGGPLSLDEARRVVDQVGSALEHAHQQSVVHRDLKPSNVLIDSQGDCYLTDFGIAKMVEGTLGLTGSGVLGTPHYMAPEQSQSLKVDHRADVYAMGVVIYEMVTGQVPFDAETPFAVVMKHISEPLPLPRSVKPDLPETVERVILKALAKNPADRYQSMRDLVTAFDQAVAAAPAEAHAATTPPRVAPMPTVVEEEVKAPPPAAIPARRRRVTAKRSCLVAAGLALLSSMMVVLVLAAVILSRMKISRQSPVGLVGTATPTRSAGAIVHETPAPSLTEVVAGETPRPTVTPSPTTAVTQPTATPAISATAPPLPVGSWQPVLDLPRQINTLVVDPTNPQVLYAGTGDYAGSGSGVYKSEDAGLTWRLAAAGLPNEQVLALAFSRDGSSTLYAAAGSEIYASTDGAESWTRLGDTGFFGVDECLLRSDPSNGNVLFAVAKSDGIARSSDGGHTWLLVGEGLPGDEHSTYALSLAIDPADTNVLYVGSGGFVGQGHGVYKSTDGGETWSPANRGMLDYRITALAVDPAHPQTVYAGGHSGELFKSSDGGQTWNNLTDRLRIQQYSYPRTIRDIVVDPAAPETIYLLGDNAGIMVSNNGGEKWRVLTKPGEHDQPSFTAMAIIFDPQPALVVGIDDAGGWRYAAD